jgi:hypothetical protein
MRDRLCGLPWLSFSCPACGQWGAVDLRTLDRHHGGAISHSVIALSEVLAQQKSGAARARGCARVLSSQSTGGLGDGNWPDILSNARRRIRFHFRVRLFDHAAARLNQPNPRKWRASKRRDKPYRSGRSPDWIKVKNPDAPAATRLIEG